MSQADDQRRSPRCEVDLFVEELAGDVTHLHPAVNLSDHGIYLLASDDRRAVDGEREMVLQFTLPGGHHVRTRGLIVHVDDHRGRRGMRVAFVDIGEGDLEAIRRFLESVLAGAEPRAQAS
jgi:hypothetical protein